MKLVVCVNHAFPFHVGGSEKVVQQITESMANDFGMDCTVLAKWADRQTTINGVKVVQCKQSERHFLEQIKSLQPDHTLVYSDSFSMWPSIVRNHKLIPGKKSIALVGMNHMRNNGDTLANFQKNNNSFKVITHSDDYIDYKTCRKMNIPVNVIPNAIDLNEFKDQGFNFRQKFNIPKDKKIILCVSNFFPGKGQEHLHHILNKLHGKRSDFFALFISSKSNYAPAESMKRRHSMMLKKAKYPSLSLTNISRKDTIQAFFESAVFAFPSQTEVAPLVALESMAAGLPYVALNVGNVPSLAGNIVCPSLTSRLGLLQYSANVYGKFTDSLDALLSDEKLHQKLSSEGKNMILSDYNWEKVREQYKNVFES